jgi:phosphatidate cytidylyltransferase
VGPFVGFLASGIKRAYGIKDFAETFPGHGGTIDRFDCQIYSVVFCGMIMS